MAGPHAGATASRLPEPRRMAIRAARERFGELLNEVAGGTYILIHRRSTPLAVMVPTDDFDRLAETFRREQELAAILRGGGFDVEPLNTPSVLEVVIRLMEASRR